MFESLSDRLTGALQGLRGKGRLTDADIDATAREIRLALLEADVSLPVVRDVRRPHQGPRQGRRGVRSAQPGPAGRQDRQRGADRHPRRRDPPTGVRQDATDGDHARRPARAPVRPRWPASSPNGFEDQGHTPLLVACDLQRPGAVNQLQIVGERAGVQVFAPHPGVRPEGYENEAAAGPAIRSRSPLPAWPRPRRSTTTSSLSIPQAGSASMKS